MAKPAQRRKSGIAGRSVTLTQIDNWPALLSVKGSGSKGIAVGIIQRFTSFDKLIGTVIVKILYWLGLIVIALGVLYLMLQAFNWMQYDVTRTAFELVMAPVVGLIAVVFWRLMCELYISIFKIANDLHDIKVSRDLKPPV